MTIIKLNSEKVVDSPYNGYVFVKPLNSFSTIIVPQLICPLHKMRAEINPKCMMSHFILDWLFL
jgi:hypothetical protein